MLEITELRRMSDKSVISMDELLERQEKEMKKLQGDVRLMLSGLKKTKLAEMEIKTIQMEYDLKAKHNDEQEVLEEIIKSISIGKEVEIPIELTRSFENSPIEATADTEAIEAAAAAAVEAKKAKAQRKRVRNIKNFIVSISPHSLSGKEVHEGAREDCAEGRDPIGGRAGCSRHRTIETESNTIPTRSTSQRSPIRWELFV